MLGDKLWLKAALTIARDIDGQFAKLTCEDFFTAAVTGVAGRVAGGVTLFMALVSSYLGFERFLHQQLGQLLE